MQESAGSYECCDRHFQVEEIAKILSSSHGRSPATL